MPDLASWVWAPAKAALGDWPALIGIAVVGFGALGGTVAFAASGFGRQAIAAASVGQQRTAQRHGAVDFRPRSVKQQLRVKEWKLLARDPWLLSQTLMQILYLVPPALYLWISYGQSAGTYVVVIPVLVMATGQLSGGLSWLAISGEDAHDLVVTAPVSAAAVLQAKIEAVATVVLVVLTPIIVLMLFASFELAATTAVFAALSSGSATAIQLWFRVPMRRAMFRRRQVASRVSTIAEALSSIFWAGAAVLVAGDQYWHRAAAGRPRRRHAVRRLEPQPQGQAICGNRLPVEARVHPSHRPQPHQHLAGNAVVADDLLLVAQPAELALHEEGPHLACRFPHQPEPLPGSPGVGIEARSAAIAASTSRPWCPSEEAFSARMSACEHIERGVGAAEAREAVGKIVDHAR